MQWQYLRRDYSILKDIAVKLTVKGNSSEDTFPKSLLSNTEYSLEVRVDHGIRLSNIKVKIEVVDPDNSLKVVVLDDFKFQVSKITLENEFNSAKFDFSFGNYGNARFAMLLTVSLPSEKYSILRLLSPIFTLTSENTSDPIITNTVTEGIEEMDVSGGSSEHVVSIHSSSSSSSSSASPSLCKYSKFSKTVKGYMSTYKSPWAEEDDPPYKGFNFVQQF